MHAAFQKNANLETPLRNLDFISLIYLLQGWLNDIQLISYKISSDAFSISV